MTRVGSGVARATSSASGRVPRDTSPNAWTLALERRRRAGGALCDLIEQNPTRVGLAGLGADERTALADALADARYEPDPRGLRAAREAISAYYAGRALTVDPDDLVLASGTSEAFAHLLRLRCDPGDRVIVPAPGYPLFAPLAALESVEAVSVPLQFAGTWRLDLEALEREATPRTRAIVVVQPNHPTGSCLSPEERERVESLCVERGIALISDEVFGDSLGGAASSPGPEPSLLGPRRATTFVLHGLSKLCGMPQLKLSWIAIAGPADARARAREGLEWIADAFLSVATPVQRALPRLLEGRHAFRRRVLERTATNRAALERRLGRCGAEVLPAAGGWVAVVRLPERTSAEALAIELIDRGVVVHPGHFYDFADDRHLVVSLLAEPGPFEDGAGRIADAVGGA